MRRQRASRAARTAPASGGGGTRYQMRQRMFAIGDDFYIQDQHGRRAFKVDGKALRVRSTLLFEDANGRELYKIQEKMIRIRDSMNIEDANGNTAAKVHNALITPLRDRWQRLPWGRCTAPGCPPRMKGNHSQKSWPKASAQASRKSLPPTCRPCMSWRAW